MHNTHNFISYTTSSFLYLEQQQMYAMRCTTFAPVEAGSHVGCQRQLLETVEAADRDCALQRTSKHRRSKRKYVQYFIQHHILYN